MNPDVGGCGGEERRTQVEMMQRRRKGSESGWPAGVDLRDRTGPAEVGLQEAAKEAEEFERLQLLKIEERRRKLEQRRLMRKINKPLINSVPKPLGSYNTYHDQVCHLPLEQLKQSLKRYQPVLDLRFSHVENSNALEKELKSTCKVITMLNSSFAAFLKIELRKKEKLTHLYVKGKCLISPEERKEGLEKNKSVKGKEIQEQVYFFPSSYNHNKCLAVVYELWIQL